MNCENHTVESLMTDLSLFYLNLKSSGGWKIKMNKHQQIIALMTKLNKMGTKFSKISKLSSNGGASLATLSAEQQEMKGNFPLWQIKKVENGAEHSMIKCDGAKWYWCEDGHSF
jgi:hypothetical protein